MKLTDIKADWSKYDCRPTWCVVNSRELSYILGVSHQTINNWKMRGVLPETKKHKNLIGNCNYWTIASIKSLIENKTETDIHFEWAERWLPNSREDFKSLGQVEYLVNHTYDLFSISKPRVPADFN